MHRPAMAYTASYWGDQAVVCRATEDRAGPVVAQEFGTFDSWTHAHHFATQVNEGLGIDSWEAREIVAGSTRITSKVIEAVVTRDTIWRRAPVLVRARVMRTAMTFARLQLALTVCRMAQSRGVPQQQRVVAEKNASATVKSCLESLGDLRLSKQRHYELEDLLQQLMREMESLRERYSDARPRERSFLSRF